MSSTVTTATVTTVTAAAGMPELGAALTMIAVLLLGVFVVCKELSVSSKQRWVRSMGRGLDIGMTPFLIAFLVLAIVNAGVYFE